MPKVIIWRDGAIESEFDPGHRDWRIGRSETNDITLLDPRKSVSRFHAELREENGRWVFIDLNSQNGSWKDGQRVNRLVLEHGHEVLFGDYKLAFEDVKVVEPPPPPPPLAGADTAAGAQTADVAIAPDQTLLMPGKKGAAPAAASVPPPPVMRPATKARPPRKGVNPVILVLFLVTMLGAVGALAWRLMTDGSDATPSAVVENEPAPSPAPAPPPPAEPAPVPAESTPPATTPEPTAVAPATPGATPTAAPGSVAPAATTPGATAPVTTPPPARPKRAAAPAAPRESPALVARYEEGRRALGASRFAEAQRAFEAVLAQQPGFRDTESLLAQAREGQAAARQKALADAQALEANGDWARAVAAYERAGASDQAEAARTKMTAAGDDAYRKARQFDARNRPADAITWYQRAVEWLPDSDARKATAQERLTALKGGA